MSASSPSRSSARTSTRSIRRRSRCWSENLCPMYLDRVRTPSRRRDPRAPPNTPHVDEGGEAPGPGAATTWRVPLSLLRPCSRIRRLHPPARSLRSPCSCRWNPSHRQLNFHPGPSSGRRSSAGSSWSRPSWSRPSSSSSRTAKCQSRTAPCMRASLRRTRGSPKSRLRNWILRTLRSASRARRCRSRSPARSVEQAAPRLTLGQPARRGRSRGSSAPRPRRDDRGRAMAAGMTSASAGRRRARATRRLSRRC